LINQTGDDIIARAGAGAGHTMRRMGWCFVCALAVSPLLAVGMSAEDSLARVAKQHEPYTLTIGLEFAKKNQNPLMRVLAGVFEPNGHATGFLVGDGLVMTSYHVVSGKLTARKKELLSFKASDDLSVNIFVNGCQASIVKIDPDSDLALLRVCVSRQTKRPGIRAAPTQDEPLLLIAQPGEQKLIRRGSFNGPYTLGNGQYLSVKIDGQDGFSGSPVYDNNGDLVGIFSLYDWKTGTALLSPAPKAQQLLVAYGG
jgi:S1-C subfamily serine protease